MPTPATRDEVIRDSRARIERMRREFGNREDFEFFIRRALGEMLAAQGYDKHTIETTMRAMFGH